MNITDVDDKTIKRSLAQKVSLETFVQPYIQAFFDDMDSLGIIKPHITPRATDYIAKMIDITQALIEKKHAYEDGQGNVYFKMRSFPNYGELSGLNINDLQEGASNRLEHDEYDRDSASDFVLWKAYNQEKDGDVFWESPFGKGRPGWHIECSAMALANLGDNIDIHCGGVDNIFPHHENEIAQSECFTCTRFARHWMHSEHLIVEGKKMSKSLGNFYTLRDLLEKGFTGREVRFALLQAHYRSQLNFTVDGLHAARQSIHRIDDFVRRLESCRSYSEDYQYDGSKYVSDLHKHVCDDLNIAGVFAALFDLIRDVNHQIDQGKIGQKDVENITSLLNSFDQILNIIYARQEEDVPAEVLQLVEKRSDAKRNKLYSEADQIRDEILKLGYVIEDTKQGPLIKKR
jgi:cysteinyl-tRNA synthetase